MENMEHTRLIWVLALVFGEYIMVLLAVIADLVSGIRKAHQRGEATHSKALRRTVDKISRYYNALFALTVIDGMQIGGITYLRMIEGFDSLPSFPIFTLLGALGIALIEVKSIYEKADEKTRNDYYDAATTLLKFMKSDSCSEFINNTIKTNSK